jgi:metallo-beta-lactamase family protein
MNITFFGAARTVTGSCTLVECAGKQLLVDCGLPQGNDEKKIGLDLPFNAAHIDFVLLTHAHIDHSGRIPLLVKEGFRGRIFCTEATKDLCSIMLADSGHIQEMEVEWLNRKRRRAGKQEQEALYTVADARQAMELFEGYPYDGRIKISEGIEIQFTDAGHLLGSSSIQLWLTENGKTRLVVFSGDVGNLDQPLVRDPVCISEADYVVIESTYGDRLHDKPEHASQQVSTEERAKGLADIIRDTFSRHGNVVIPSFAVGRTQEILYLLRVIITHKMLPEIQDIPVFLDSPLAIEATKVFSRNIEGYFDEEAMQLVRGGVNPLSFPTLTTTVTADESRELNLRKESSVIISSSGMCEAGRIKHHLKHNLWRPESTIVFCGYQANGTLGRSILDGAEKVSIFGEQIDVRAAVKKLEGISGHADQEGLVNWLSCFKKKPKHLFVVHGEDRVAEWFAGFITTTLDMPAWAPKPGESFDLITGRLPAARPAVLESPGRKEIQEAFDALETVLVGIDAVVTRLREHARDLDMESKPQQSIRLADAVIRLTNDLETLRSRWDPNGKSKSPAE